MYVESSTERSNPIPNLCGKLHFFLFLIHKKEKEKLQIMFQEGRLHACLLIKKESESTVHKLESIEGMEMHKYAEQL